MPAANSSALARPVKGSAWSTGGGAGSRSVGRTGSASGQNVIAMSTAP